MVTFASKTHRHTYEAIDPYRLALSQRGRTIVVAGGSSGIGYATAHAFALASADRVIVLGCRPEVVSKAADPLHAMLPSNFQREVQGRVVDISSL